MKLNSTPALLGALMIVLILAACSRGNEELSAGPSAGVPSPSVSAADDTAAAETAEYVDPGLDFEGAEFILYTWHPTTILNRIFFTDHYDGVDSEGLNGDSVNDAVYERTRLVEQQLGVTVTDLEYEVYDQAGAYTKSVMAGDRMFDAVLGNLPFIRSINAADSALIADLNDYGLNLGASWYNQNANIEYNIKGRQFCTTGDLCLYNSAALGALFYNKNMIEAYGLETPYRQVYDGAWTLDRWEQYAKQVSGDLNGNGEHDLEDCYGISASKTVMSMLTYSSGVRVSTKNADGISELTLNCERMQQVVDKAVRLLRDESISLFAGVGRYQGSGTSLFLQNFLDDRLLFHFTWVYSAYEMRDMKADFGIVPFPKYDESQTDYHCVIASAYGTYLFLPVTCDKYDMAAPVLDAMGYYAQQMVTPVYIDSTVTDKLMRDEDSGRMIRILMDGRVYDLYDLYGWGKLGDIPSNLSFSNSTDFSSAYAAAEPAALLALADTFR